MARNSVLQSNWEHSTKEQWIGENYFVRGSSGNDIHRTNVPDCRLDFRNSLLTEEEHYLRFLGYPDLRRHSINSLDTDHDYLHDHSLPHEMPPEPATVAIGAKGREEKEEMFSLYDSSNMTSNATNQTDPFAPTLPLIPSIRATSDPADDMYVVDVAEDVAKRHETADTTGSSIHYDTGDESAGGGVISTTPEAQQQQQNATQGLVQVQPLQNAKSHDGGVQARKQKKELNEHENKESSPKNPYQHRPQSASAHSRNMGGYHKHGSVRNDLGGAGEGQSPQNLSSPNYPPHPHKLHDGQRAASMRSVIVYGTERAQSPEQARMTKFAFEMAHEANLNARFEPPHEKWIELAKERKRLEIIRDEITKFMENNNIANFDDISHKNKNKSKSKSTATSNDNDNKSSNIINSIDGGSSSSSSGKTTPNPQDSKQTRIEKQARRLSMSSKATNEAEMKKHRSTDYIAVTSIVGEYYDENNGLNMISEDLTVAVDGVRGTFNAILATHDKFNDKYHKKHKKNKFIVADLRSQNKADLIQNSSAHFADLFDSNDTASAELDVLSGELIWSTGVVWFKNEWNLLKGAWEDDNGNIIEIRQDNTARYLKGYGPFRADIVGFKQVRVELPNQTYLEGDIIDVDEIKFENGDKWKRHSFVLLLLLFFVLN